MQNFSKIGFHILFSIVLVGMIKNTVLYGVYGLDRGLFVTLFCENKNNPVMKCNGKCKLAEMQQEEEKEKSASLLSKVESEILFYPANNSVTVAGFSERNNTQNLAGYHKIAYADPIAKRSIKPPEFIVFV